MNHDKATENYFKARGFEEMLVFCGYDFNGAEVEGWRLINLENGDRYVYSKSEDGFDDPDLPNICESMTDWIKYVAEFMEGENLTFECMDGEARWWDNDNEVLLSKEIKDHQILYASVLAANKYLRRGNGISKD